VFGSGDNYRMYELTGGIYDWDAFGNLTHQWLRFRLFTKWTCSKAFVVNIWRYPTGHRSRIVHGVSGGVFRDISQTLFKFNCRQCVKEILVMFLSNYYD